MNWKDEYQMKFVEIYEQRKNKSSGDLLVYHVNITVLTWVITGLIILRKIETDLNLDINRKFAEIWHLFKCRR